MYFRKQTYYKWRKKEKKYFPKLREKIVRSSIREIIYLIKEKANTPLRKLKVLDVGCGAGEYSFEIQKYVDEVVGIEPYNEIYKEAVKNKNKLNSKVFLHNLTVEKFITNEKFDLVLSLTTIEHMANSKKAFNKIFRLIKKGGFLYITAPNKLWPWEPHYNLPFLYWLPLPIANIYIRFTKKGKSYEDSAYAKTYMGMKKFLNQFPCEYEFILPRNLNSPNIGHEKGGVFYKLLKSLGVWLISKNSFFWNFSKGFIILAKKI